MFLTRHFDFLLKTRNLLVVVVLVVVVVVVIIIIIIIISTYVTMVSLVKTNSQVNWVGKESTFSFAKIEFNQLNVQCETSEINKKKGGEKKAFRKGHNKMF